MKDKTHRVFGYQMLIRMLLISTSILTTPLMHGCAQVDLKQQIDIRQMTYQALRQQDCRLNEPKAFCARNFSNEYREYKRLRQDFIRTEQVTQTRRNNDSVANPDNPKLKLWVASP